MSSFCIIKNKSTEKFYNKVGDNQAAAIAEMVNRKEPVYIKNNGKLIRSKLFDKLLIANNNDYIASFEQYIQAYNTNSFDNNGEPVLDIYYSEITDNAINDADLKVNIKLLNNYKLRQIKFPEDKALTDTIKRYPNINFAQFDNYEKAKAYNINYDYMNITINNFDSIFYGDNGYAKEGAINSIIGDRQKEVELTGHLNHLTSFIKGFSTIRNIEVPSINNPDASEIALINAINRLKGLGVKVDQLEATHTRLLKEYFDNVLTSISTNPEIKIGFRDIFDIQDDESKVQLMLDSLADTHHSFVSNFIKRFIVLRGKAKEEGLRKIRTYNNDIEKLKAKGFSFNDILEYKDGNPTGKLISEFDDSYIDINKEYYNAMVDAEKNYGKYSVQYYEAEKRYNKWKIDNMLQRQSNEVVNDRFRINDILFSNFEARRRLDLIDDKIHNILNIYDKTFSIFELSDNDIQLLNQYNYERKLLSYEYDKDGNIKTGIDLEVAKTLQKYNEEISIHIDKYYDTINNENFEANLNKHKDNLSNESKDWLKRNTKSKLKQEFWDNLSKYNQILGKFQEDNTEKSKLLKPFRDDEGNIIGNIVPDVIKAKIKKENESKFKNVDIKENRIIKAIRKPKDNNVYTDDYYLKFENSGYSSLDDNKTINNAVDTINSILKKYTNNGLIDYSAISINDLIQINDQFDRIDYVSTQYTYDKKKLEFLEWLSDNHDFIIDEESFNKAATIAKSKGSDYYREWLKTNTEFKFTDDFYNEIEDLKKLYNIPINSKSKKDITITKINYDLLRRKFSTAKSFVSLPDNVKYIIKSENDSKLGYTLSERINNRKKIKKYKEDLSDSDIIKELQISISSNHKQNIESELKSTYPKYTNYKAAYNNLFDKTTSPKYYELLKEFGTDSQWYLDNHTINNEGEIEPVAFWTILKPKAINHYNENSPKSKIWGYSVVNNDSYVDKSKTEAKTWINENVLFNTTTYYDDTFNKNKEEMSEEEFNIWFNNNHIFNPYTNKYDPISIWTSISTNNELLINKYEPKSHLKTIKVKDEYSNELEINKNLDDPYRDIFGYALPKKTSTFYNKEFDKIKNNELYNYIKSLLNDLTKHYGKQTLIDAGWLPIMKDNKKDKDVLGKIKKSIGLFSYNNDSIVGENNESIKIFNLPFIEKFTIEKLLELPLKKDNQTDLEFDTEYKEILAKNKEIKAKNEEYNKSIIDNDYENVLRLFIPAAINNKFLIEQEHEMKLGIEQIRKLEFFKRKSALSKQRSRIDTNEDQELYDQTENFAKTTGSGTNLLTHFEKFIEMIFYGDFEKDEGTITQISRLIQNFTSAKGMWFNVPGAFNNVAYGKSQIAMERYSGYFFNNADRLRAEKDYWANSIYYFKDIGSDKSSSLISALIKKFDVVEIQDEKPLTNNDELNKSITKHLMSTNSLYILRHIGEHYMQNSALLSMMYSNRIINGEIKSLNEYKLDLRYKALKDSLSDENKEKLDSFMTKNKYVDKYIDNSSDILRDFILKSDSGVQESFLNTLKEYNEEAELKFKTYTRLIDAYDFVDGYAELKKDIQLDDEQIILFQRKVISVNQKIHGIYNKLDAGTNQNTAIGRLAMQYRKWMRPGWNKRFGARFGKGSWNENRNELDNGSYITFLRFLTKPILDNLSHEKFKNEFESSALIAFNNIIKDYKTYLSNMSLYWNTLSSSEQASVKRTLIEFSYFVGALLIFGLFKKLGDEDDELQDTKGYAYGMYALDRLKSELRAYEPLFGWFNESRKLMKDPFASMSAIDDMMKLLYTIGFEYDEKYKGGSYHGGRKVHIQLLKNIPLMNRYLRYSNIENINGYYKLYGY